MSGPHDFAVRVQRIRLLRHPRPSHPAPNVRDDREAPLMRAQDARRTPLIWGKREAKYFRERDWTDKIRLRSFENIGFPRKRFSGLRLPRSVQSRTQFPKTLGIWSPRKTWPGMKRASARGTPVRRSALNFCIGLSGPSKLSDFADTVVAGIGRTRFCHRTYKCGQTIGTRSVQSIRASGRTCCINRPERDRTRPMLHKRQKVLGAVLTHLRHRQSPSSVLV